MNPPPSQAETREPQYQCCLALQRKQGLAQFGLMSNYMWRNDPRHLAFLMSRYKFVAKMLSGRQRVLEIGCADAFATRVVLQEVRHLTAIDFDPVFIQDAQQRMDSRWPFDCRVHDMVKKPLDATFDAAYALDVLEHIPPAKENRFIGNIAKSLTEQGVLIIGLPSLASQAYASEASKQGHVNCKDHQGLKQLLGAFFHNVFLFSMNDEVVHTGFYPMAQYLLGLACSKRKR